MKISNIIRESIKNDTLFLEPIEISKKYKICLSTVYNIKKSENIESKIPNKKYNLNDEYFENIDTEEKAYWLGFLYADGYVRIKDGRSGELRLKLKTGDRKHIELFNKHIGSDYNIKDITTNVKGVDSFASFVSIYNTKLVNDLIKHGCVSKKSFIVEFPNIDKSLERHFIRGFFDGDGWFFIRKIKNGIYPNFGICSASKIIIDQIYKILENNNIICRFERSGVTYRVCNTCNDYMEKIHNYLYSNSSVYLDRKFNIFSDYLSDKKPLI